jgi:hypothetical protein
MEKRQAADFMITPIRISCHNALRGLLVLALLFGCSRDLSDDPIPIVPFPDLVINLSFPDYLSLAVDGGYKLIGNIGVRGVIVYRKSPTAYIAYERNCSYHPNEAGSTVDVNVTKLFMTDASCGSNFNFSDGMPSAGVAWRPLRRYRTVLSGTSLTITSDIEN